MFAVASFSAQWMLRRELSATDPEESEASLDAPDLDRHLCFRRHPDGLGPPAVHRRPGCPVQFFREGSWSNAYEVVIQMVWDVLSGRREEIGGQLQRADRSLSARAFSDTRLLPCGMVNPPLTWNCSELAMTQDRNEPVIDEIREVGPAFRREWTTIPSGCGILHEPPRATSDRLIAAPKADRSHRSIGRLRPVR